jgi:hypothetical protein
MSPNGFAAILGEASGSRTSSQDVALTLDSCSAVAFAIVMKYNI